jgi:hypothetical protein
MQKLLIPALIATVMVTTAQTRKQYTQSKKLPEASIIWDGNQLHKLCEKYKDKKYDSQLGVGCSFYISGAAQTLVLNDDVESSVLRQPCPGKGVTNEQIVDVVVKWLDDHPENRELPAPYIIMDSLTKSFPCR